MFDSFEDGFEAAALLPRWFECESSVPTRSHHAADVDVGVWRSSICYCVLVSGSARVGSLAIIGGFRWLQNKFLAVGLEEKCVSPPPNDNAQSFVFPAPQARIGGGAVIEEAEGICVHACHFRVIKPNLALVAMRMVLTVF